VVCGEALPAGALKCNECNSVQVVRSCPACKLPTPAHDQRCIHCKTYPDGDECWQCGGSIPKGARRCNDCNVFQNWRRFVPMSEVTLALILSIISVISAVAPPVVRYFSNHSETYVHVLGTGRIAEEPTIRVLVVNSGKRASFVKSARIIFDRSGQKRIDADETDLEVKNPDDALIAPGEHAVIQFSVGSVARVIGADNKTITSKSDVLKQVLLGGNIMIRVTVEETNRDGKPFDAFPNSGIRSDKLYDWMVLRVAS